MWFEEFAIWTVWARTYSPNLLGASRPPMAALARDIMSLVEALKNQGTLNVPQPMLEFLNRFCAYSSLFSIPSYAEQSRENIRASTGLLTDMFSIAVSAGRSDFGRDDRPDLDTFSNGYLEFVRYPGPDALRLGKRPLNRDAYKDLWGNLEDMTASFIDSGPYKIELSFHPSEHLTLSLDGKLRLFWEGPQYWTKEGEASLLYPGQPTFKKYKALTLGRYRTVHCSC